jgi:hypothetical protein
MLADVAKCEMSAQLDLRRPPRWRTNIVFTLRAMRFAARQNIIVYLVYGQASAVHTVPAEQLVIGLTSLTLQTCMYLTNLITLMATLVSTTTYVGPTVMWTRYKNPI